jgi:hypothetical protein
MTVKFEKTLLPNYVDGMAARLPSDADTDGLSSLTAVSGRRRGAGQPTSRAAARSASSPGCAVLVGVLALINHDANTGLRVTQAVPPSAEALRRDRAKPLGARIWLRNDSSLCNVRLICRRLIGSKVLPNKEIRFTYSGHVSF